MGPSGTRAWVGFSPSRMGSGVAPRRFLANLFPMDFNSILAPVIDFFSNGIGAVIRDIAVGLYNVLFPANADAATTPKLD